MSNQRASCCGPADEATTAPAKTVETTDRTGVGRVAASDPVSRERGSSGLLRAVRRFFGRAPA